MGQPPQQGTFPSPNRIKGGSGDVAANLGGRPDDSIPFTIASGTGGLVVSGSNDLVAQLQKIGAEQSQSYVLGYTPPDSKEGSLPYAAREGGSRRHGGAVEVELLHGQAAGPARGKPGGAGSGEDEPRERRAAPRRRFRLRSFTSAPNVARVHVAMEIATDALKFENQKGKLHAEMNILGIASGPDGGVAARFSDIVKRDFDNKQDLDSWKAESLHYEKEFKIVPGQYNLTVVFSSGGANFGKVETPLTVPGYRPKPARHQRAGFEQGGAAGFGAGIGSRAD